MTEKYKLTVDIARNCYISSENWKCGMFTSIERKQVERVIDKLNEQEEEIQRLKKEIDDTWRKYENAHGISIRNTDWY